MDQMEVEMNETQDSKGNIQTQLQEEYLKSLESLEEGQLVDGTVIQVTPEQVFVDVGYKSEGKIPTAEFKELPKVGDVVSVVLITKENRHGEVIVSKQKADLKQLWKTLRQAAQDKTPVDGKICRVIKGGFEVDLGSDIKAFLPVSQSDSQKVEKSEKLIEQIQTITNSNGCEIVINKSICNAQKQINLSSAELAKNSDTMIVVGGKNSSNSIELFNNVNSICPSIFIEEIDDWKSAFDSSNISISKNTKIGITAGASTNKDELFALKQKIEDYLRG